MAGVKRHRLQGARAPPTWAVVRGMLHRRLKDAAAELNVPITYLRSICRRNGYPNWPGKRIRFLNGIGRNPMLVDAAESSSSRRAGLAAGSSLLVAMVAEIPEPVANAPPRELVTLNLIDKVGIGSSSSTSSEDKAGSSYSSSERN